MTDYNNTYGGAAKDGAEATILGADIDTQLDSLETHVATKADKITSPDLDNILTMDGNGNLKDSTQTVAELTLAIKQVLEPVGTIFHSTSATNPGTSKGFGTWVQISKGRVLIGEGTGAGLTARTAAAEIGQEDAIIPTHGHTATQAAHTHTTPLSTTSGNDNVGQTGATGTNFNRSGSSATPAITVDTATGGESVTDKNIPPALVVYIWERTV